MRGCSSLFSLTFLITGDDRIGENHPDVYTLQYKNFFLRSCRDVSPSKDIKPQSLGLFSAPYCSPELSSAFHSRPNRQLRPQSHCSGRLSRPDNVDSRGRVTKILEICLIFFPFLPSIHFPARISSGGSFSLFLSQSHCFHSPHSHSAPPRPPTPLRLPPCRFWY